MQISPVWPFARLVVLVENGDLVHRNRLTIEPERGLEFTRFAMVSGVSVYEIPR